MRGVVGRGRGIQEARSKIESLQPALISITVNPSTISVIIRVKQPPDNKASPGPFTEI